MMMKKKNKTDRREQQKKRKMEEDKKMPSTSFEAKDYLGEYSFKTSPNRMSKTYLKLSPSKPVAEVPKQKNMEENLDNLEKKENLAKTMTEMEEKITQAVSDKLKDLLVQILDKQQPKQEVTIKEEKKDKDGENIE
jgi:hypothetical protein